MPETISSLDELVKATHEEYEKLEFEFDTGVLRMIVGNLESKKIDENVAASVDEALDSHLDRTELKDRAMRFDDRKEPPNYRAFVLEVLREEPSPRSKSPTHGHSGKTSSTVSIGTRL